MENKPKKFKRYFDIDKINKLSPHDKVLFEKLKSDVANGSVFPAVRNNELHFYYKGGCLYKIKGNKFDRAPEYENYNQNTDGLSDYDKAKKQNENKFKTADDKSKERQILDRLYKHTFSGERGDVVVIDIEIRLNGETNGAKKCDLCLLNAKTNQIMFVEGKIFKDNRVNVKQGNTPKVTAQVNGYSAAMREQRPEIETQYAEHIAIINALFLKGKPQYDPNVKLILPAKLIVYETPKNPNENARHSICVIETILKNDVMWILGGVEPTLDEIWGALCK